MDGEAESLTKLEVGFLFPEDGSRCLPGPGLSKHDYINPGLGQNFQAF